MGFDLEDSLMVLQGSVVDNVATVEAMPQEVENYNFDTSTDFNVDWD